MINKSIVSFLSSSLFFIVIVYYQNSSAMEKAYKNCATESLADKKIKNTLKQQFLWTTITTREIAKRKNILIKDVKTQDFEEYLEGKLGPLKRKPTQEDYLELCLNGKLYKALARAGSGDEGDVYKIMDITGKVFALKVYTDEFSKFYQKGDLIAMKKAQKSREFLNVPLEVSIEYKYSLLPFLDTPYKLKPNIQLFTEFENKLDAALQEDNLLIGDADNKENYMYDKNGRLWRIDLSTLEESKTL